MLPGWLARSHPGSFRLNPGSLATLGRLQSRWPSEPGSIVLRAHPVTFPTSFISPSASVCATGVPERIGQPIRLASGASYASIDAGIGLALLLRMIPRM